MGYESKYKRGEPIKVKKIKIKIKVKTKIKIKITKGIKTMQ